MSERDYVISKAFRGLDEIAKGLPSALRTTGLAVGRAKVPGAGANPLVRRKLMRSSLGAQAGRSLAQGRNVEGYNFADMGRKYR